MSAWGKPLEKKDAKGDANDVDMFNLTADVKKKVVSRTAKGKK